MDASMDTQKKYIRFFLCGTAMGAADIVPGVSGGTIAYLTGIYPLLLQSISAFNAGFLRTLFSSRWKEAIRLIPWHFLIPLLCGILLSLLCFSRIIHALLLTHPQMVWGFFFGLLVSSILLMLRQHPMTTAAALMIAAGAGAAFVLTHVPAFQFSHALPSVFLSGAIALCAMILPGISGSFMLVLLGQYSFMLQAVVQWNIPVLAVFILGGISGLAAFSRLLTFCFRRFPLRMHALMLGIMVGCLPIVWPWKTGQAAMPDASSGTPAVCLACLAGILIPLALTAAARHEKNKEMPL